METLKCIYNNEISDFIIKRTCITIKNNTFEKTLGFFDIRYFIYDNRLLYIILLIDSNPSGSF